MTALRRIFNIVAHPTAEWDAIAREPASVPRLLLAYVLPLALLAPVATVIGMRAFGTGWDPAHGYRVDAADVLAAGVTTYVAIVGSILLLAGIFVLIAPLYGSSRSYVAALKVATFGSVPVLLAGATLVIPAMALAALIASLHTLFLYSEGIGRVLQVRADSRTEFVGASLVLLVGCSTLIGAAASGIGLI